MLDERERERERERGKGGGGSLLQKKRVTYPNNHGSRLFVS